MPLRFSFGSIGKKVGRNSGLFNYSCRVCKSRINHATCPGFIQEIFPYLPGPVIVFVLLNCYRPHYQKKQVAVLSGYYICYIFKKIIYIRCHQENLFAVP